MSNESLLEHSLGLPGYSYYTTSLTQGAKSTLYKQLFSWSLSSNMRVLR